MIEMCPLRWPSKELLQLLHMNKLTCGSVILWRAAGGHIHGWTKVSLHFSNISEQLWLVLDFSFDTKESNLIKSINKIKVESTWGLEKQFTVDELQSVFGEDSLESTLALSHDVNTPAEIKDRFGGISYNKGGSVIRMFEHALGHDTFIAAIRNYLRNKWVLNWILSRSLRNEKIKSIPRKLISLDDP